MAYCCWCGRESGWRAVFPETGPCGCACHKKGEPGFRAAAFWWGLWRQYWPFFVVLAATALIATDPKPGMEVFRFAVSTVVLTGMLLACRYWRKE